MLIGPDGRFHGLAQLPAHRGSSSPSGGLGLRPPVSSVVAGTDSLGARASGEARLSTASPVVHRYDCSAPGTSVPAGSMETGGRRPPLREGAGADRVGSVYQFVAFFLCARQSGQCSVAAFQAEA
jgi:hypothetical protein